MKTIANNSVVLCILLFFATQINTEIFAQVFNATGVPVNIVNGAQTLTNCETNRKITFNVSGVGVLTSAKQLIEVDITAKSNRNLRGEIYLKSPSGTCVKIADRFGGDLGLYTAQNIVMDYKFRTKTHCLDKSPDYVPSGSNINYGKSSDGNYGVFSTIDSLSKFIGENADGTWTMSFVRGSSNTPPTITGASLRFGTLTSLSPPSLTAGNSCVNAINWSGIPLCGTTDGKNNTSNRPPNSITGCAGATSWPPSPGEENWISTSENNLWIKFTPTDSDVCINISGIRKVSGNGATGLQSIVVEPSTADQCSGSWKLVNCPRDMIYGSTSGTTLSHNHCFTATVGKTYYLVIDGNAGAISEVYITGISGLPVILSAELIDFSYDCSDGLGSLKWQTATEKNNDYFVIDYSKNGFDWYELGRKEASGNSKDIREYEYTLTQRFADGYFRLKQVDYDGTETLLQTIVATNCGQSKFNLQVVPNPSNGQFYILDANTYQSVQVVDMLGKEIYFNDQISDKSTLSIDLSTAKKGTYIISVVDTQGDKYIERLVIE